MCRKRFRILSNLHHAIQVAGDFHYDQFRKEAINGVEIPYITHPLEVLKRIYVWGLTDEDAMIAATCHDLLEDTDIERDYLVNLFGERAVGMVDELTLIHNTSLSPSDWRLAKEEYIESFKAKSLEALIIKVADRICNIQDFIDTNIGYARKYYAKSKRLFEIWKERFDSSDLVQVKVDNSVNEFLAKCDKIFQISA